MVALLAGCAGDGQDGAGGGDGDGGTGTGDGGTGTGDGGTGTEGGQLVDATLRTFERNWMDEAELNPFSNSRAAGPAWHLFPSIGMYSTAATFNQDETVEYNEFVPVAAEEWSFGDGQWTITLRDDWEWTSGDPVTSADLALRLRLMEYVDEPIWKYISGVSEVDERTVALEIDGEVDEQLLQHTLLGIGTQVDTPAEIDGEETQFAVSLEKLQDASGQDAEDEALLELVEYNWYPGDAALNGPFAVTNATRNELILERHDGFYDPVNFTEASLQTLDLGETGAPSQAITSKQIDIGVQPSPEVAQSLDEQLELAIRRGTSGVGFGMNYSDPGGGVLNERNVRRAIAHLLSPQNASQNSNPLIAGVFDGAPTGLINSAEWISEDTLSQFDTYGVDKSRAEELMQEAGLSRDGDSWTTPDGETLSVEVTTAPWHIFPAIGQTVVGVLQDFGIQTNLNSLGSDAFVNTMWGDGSFATALGVWGAAHPANAFDLPFGENNVWNTPAELEVPMPVGDSEGDLETINVRERTAELPSLSGDELESEIETLAWAFNQTLPVIPLVTENVGATYWTDNWSYPERDSPFWGTDRPKPILYSHGLVEAKR